MQIKDCNPGDTIELDDARLSNWYGYESGTSLGKRYKLGTEHKPSDYICWVECYELPRMIREFLNKNLNCRVVETVNAGLQPATE